MRRSIKELLKEAAGQLSESGNSRTPILDAELLLVHVLNSSGMEFDRIKLVTRQDLLLDEDTVGKYLRLVEERKRGKPVQYITNKQEFMGYELYVEPGVLIPRGDTETVVEKVIGLAGRISGPRIIDMCTGSGAIAVSLAGEIPGAMVWAVDISDSAVECSRINAVKHGLEKRIKVIKSDLFDNLGEEGLEGSIDIIVSNPPYIESGSIQELQASVRDYEPPLALDGGEDGLVYYRRIVRDSPRFLRNNGILAFEVGYNQGGKVRNIMEKSGFYHGVETLKDLAGFDRCVWGYRKGFGE